MASDLKFLVLKQLHVYGGLAGASPVSDERSTLPVPNHSDRPAKRAKEIVGSAVHVVDSKDMLNLTAEVDEQIQLAEDALWEAKKKSAYKEHLKKSRERPSTELWEQFSKEYDEEDPEVMVWDTKKKKAAAEAAYKDINTRWTMGTLDEVDARHRAPNGILEGDEQKTPRRINQHIHQGHPDIDETKFTQYFIWMITVKTAVEQCLIGEYKAGPWAEWKKAMVAKKAREAEGEVEGIFTTGHLCR